jgi:integrase
MPSMAFGMRGKHVFESEEKPEQPYCDVQFRHWFSRVIQAAGIKYVRKMPKERGSCPHCLRHLFVIRSFLQSEEEGRSFEDTVPYLSIYLGHKSLMETEKYLRADHILYTRSHDRVNEYLNEFFLR